MSISRETKLRLADVLVKTVGALLVPTAGGTLAGELGAWFLEKKLGADPEKELRVQIGETVDAVTKKSLRTLVTTFPEYEVEAAAVMVVSTVESVELDLGGLVDVGLSAKRLNDLYLAAAPSDLEDQLGEAAVAYRTLLAEICYRLERLFLGNAYVHGRILRELLDRRRGEDVLWFKRKTEWDDDEFTWDYRFEARELMPAAAVEHPSGTRIELSLDAVFQEPHAELDGETGPILGLVGSGRGWIVRGAAGVGKTFLLRCLALKAFTGGLPEELADWRSRVPLYFDLSGGAEPVPADALARFDRRLASRAPTGWAERLLQGGDMLLLIDEVDDHPQEKNVTRLIADALAAGCVVVVNARSDVPAAWTAELGLREIRLLEMSPLEVDRFVVRWHDAVADECGTGAERETIRDAREALLLTIGRCTDIRRLCAGPIFLAGFCREFLSGGLALPDDRAALVERVLRATTGQDPLRTGEAVPADDWECLIELAHWSAQNDREFTRAQAATWLATTPNRIDELARRHRMLRECDGDRLSFVREAVRASLAARFRAQREFVGELVDWAAVREKREAVVAAAACLPRAAASELLRRLNATGQPGVARAALHVMKQVDGDALAATMTGAAGLIPPQSQDQVDRVVEVGSCLLDLLTHEPAGPWTADAVLALAEARDLAAVATVAATADAVTRQKILTAWKDHQERAALHEMIRYREERS